MRTKQTQKTKRCCSAVLVGVLLAALSAGCSNPAGGNKPSGGSAGGGGTPGGGGSGTLPAAPFVAGGASLILSPEELYIRVTAKTADNSPITVEGCIETAFQSSDVVTRLTIRGKKVIFKGNITELYFWGNQLAALNVQGLTALKKLCCDNNQLTALNVQGCASLQELDCYSNQLTALNVQGCASLQKLKCDNNQLTALNVQGCASLQELYCYGNKLTALDVQGLTTLRELWCDGNKLTELNVQGCTALQWLNCGGNQLAALNVQGCTALKKLYCYGNRLTADVFKTLFDNLPQRQDSDYAKCILYTEETGVSEGNHKVFSAPPDLAAAFTDAKNNKKWTMCKCRDILDYVEI